MIIYKRNEAILMRRLQSIIVAVNTIGVQNLLVNLNLQKVDILAFVVDGGDKIDIRIGGRKVPGFSYETLQEVVEKLDSDKLYYLITGFQNHLREYGMLNRILRLLGRVPKTRILNMSALLTQWPLAYRYAINGGLEYFATGISYMEVGLSLIDLPLGRGVNLAISSQDIYCGLETAKRILPCNPELRYAFIGVAPYSFSYIMKESFSTRGLSMQYELVWGKKADWPEMFLFKESFIESNRDFDGIYNPDTYLHDGVIGMGQLLNLDRELQDIIPRGNPAHIKKNKQWMAEYITLCQNNGVIPIAVILPMSAPVHNAFSQASLREYRDILRDLENMNNLIVLDFWDMKTDLSWFYDLTHLNRKGAKIITQNLVVEMKRRQLIL